jgi:DNA invertase Pin-like site-specific DNA recombinase
MKILYARVSSDGQNESRQLLNRSDYDYVFVDKCSGAIPLWDRPKGSEVKKLLDSGSLTRLEVHSIDRLGRSTLDVLSIWKELTEKGVVVTCRNPTLVNIDEHGNVNAFSSLMMAILSTMSDFERSLIKERQAEGIRLRKARGLYRGRSIGTKDSVEKFLSKPKTILVSKYLNRGLSYGEIQSIVGCSPNFISKVKRLSAN